MSIEYRKMLYFIAALSVFELKVFCIVKYHISTAKTVKNILFERTKILNAIHEGEFK